MDPELSPAATNVVATVAVSVVLCSLAIWIVVLGRLIRRQPILPLRPRRPVPWGLVHVGVIGLIYLGLELAAAVWVGARVREATGQGGLMVLLDARSMPVFFGAAAAAKVMALAIGAAVLYLTAGAKGDDLGFSATDLGSQILLGIAAFLAIVPPVFAIQLLTSMLVPYEHPVIELLMNDASIGNLLLTTVLAVLVAPLVEEFLFRLVLQGWLQRFEWFSRGGPRLAATSAEQCDASVETATPVEEQPTIDSVDDPNNAEMRPVLPLLGVVPICISSLVFALMHFGQGAAPIPLFVLSLGLGYLYARTGRLLPCILVHMLLNGTSMAILWLSIYEPA